MPAVALLKPQTMTLEGQRVRVAIRRAAPGSPTVLFLHGYPDTLQVFAAAVAALPESWGYVAPDFPGQGKSARSAPESPTASPTDRARWLASLLDTALVPLVRVFAHDMGAHAALELARLHPRRVERLVLAHSLLDPSAPMSLTLTWLRKSAAYRVLLPAFPGRVVKKCFESFLAPNQALTPLVARDVQDAFTMQVGRFTASVCDAAEDWLRGGLDRYRVLEMPVTILTGTRNLHFPREHAEALAREVRQAKVVEVPGGWHWLVWHLPDAVVRALSA